MIQSPVMNILSKRKTLTLTAYGAFFGIVLALAAIAFLPKLYRADMVIAPAERSYGIDLGNALQSGQSGAVQFLMQRLGSAASADFTSFQNRLKTGEVAKQILDQPTLLQGLFYKDWNEKAQKWDGGDKPSLAQTRKKIQDAIIIRPVGTTALISIAYHHPDPAFAVNFLNALFQKTDIVMKAQLQKRANTRIAYLQQRLKEPQTRDQEAALVAMLKEQEHLKMISAIDVPYAAIMLEAPIASAKSVSPNKTILILTLTILGALSGCALSRHHHQNHS